MWFGRFIMKIIRKVIVSIILFWMYPFIFAAWMVIDEYVLFGPEVSPVGIGYILVFLIGIAVYITSIGSLILEYTWEKSNKTFDYVYVLLHGALPLIVYFSFPMDFRYFPTAILFGLVFVLLDRLLNLLRRKLFPYDDGEGNEL